MYKRIHKYLYSVGFVICLYYLCISFYLASVSTERPYFYDEIIRNWKLEPIQSVRQIAYSQECDSDTEEAVFFMRWPGTYIGCECPSDETYLYLSECSEYQKNQNGCSDVREFNVQILNHINLLGKRTKLCMTRFQGLNFYENYDNFNKDGCDEGQKSCGNGFCIDVALDCPVNNVYVTTNSTVIEGTTQFNLQNGSYIKFDTLSIDPPAVDFRISEGLGVCVNQAQPNISPGREDYLLLRFRRSECSTIDSNYRKVFDIGEQNLFMAFPEYLEMNSELVGYDMSNSYGYGFYYRQYTRWDTSCYGFTMTQFKQLKGVYGLLIYLLVEDILLQLVVTFCLIYYYFLHSFLNIDKVYYKDHNHLAYWLFTVKKHSKKTKILMAALLFEKFFSFTISQIFNDFFLKLDQKQCLDELTNTLFLEHQNQFKTQVLVFRQINFGLVFFLIVYYVTITNFILKPTPKASQVLQFIQSENDFYGPVLLEDKQQDAKTLQENNIQLEVISPKPNHKELQSPIDQNEKQNSLKTEEVESNKLRATDEFKRSKKSANDVWGKLYNNQNADKDSRDKKKIEEQLQGLLSHQELRSHETKLKRLEKQMGALQKKKEEYIFSNNYRMAELVTEKLAKLEQLQYKIVSNLFQQKK